jgi:CRP/FNR family transcriptional regulator, cyclic AMP receptor protein
MPHRSSPATVAKPASPGGVGVSGEAAVATQGPGAGSADVCGLRGIALFHDLPDAVLAEVAGVCRFRLHRARQAVISRDDLDRDCYLIVSGRVRVIALSPGGREVSFRDAGAGEAIGEIAALDGRPRSASVIALQDSVLARLSPEALTDLLRRHWPICERMLHRLAGSARQLTERVYELSTLSVQQRLCAELLREALAAAGPWAESTGAADAPGGVAHAVLSPPPSHSELAARISSYREQVTRELTELARLGLVRRDEGRLVIDDLAQLAERVEGPRGAH